MRKADIARVLAEIGVLLKREGASYHLSAAPRGIDLMDVDLTEAGWRITTLVMIPGAADHFATSITIPAGRHMSAEMRSVSTEAFRRWCAFVGDVAAKLNPVAMRERPRRAERAENSP